MKMFNKDERAILSEVAIEIEEVLVNTRKGIAQSKYVFKVEADATYYNEYHINDDDMFVTPPNELVGHWMMTQTDDLSYIRLDECIKNYEWVKCMSVPVTTYKWVESE